MDFRIILLLLATLVPTPVSASSAQGRSDSIELGSAEALERHHPQLLTHIKQMELVHAALFDALSQGPRAIALKENDSLASLEDELIGVSLGMIEEYAFILVVPEPFAVLGTRAAEVMRWGHAFQREVLSILADPEVEDPRGALSEAVLRYRAKPEAALPGAPKNMDVLYDHAFGLGFRTHYPQLSGLTWAGHWLRLAGTEPLTDLAPGPERVAGIDTVVTRFLDKLSFGEAPQSFPSELPLAPAIAPGLIWLSPESAMIWDNLSMLMEVLADVLAAAEPAQASRAIEAVVDFFLDPEAAVTDQDEWEIMALRHGIFYQGGFPIAVMTRSERNESGHAAHLQGGRVLRAIPGMRR